MENKPKRSKAFIITFILILLLLIIGYYMFRNREQIFGTKGSTSLNKVFAPLLGSSKNKDLKVVTTENPDNTKNVNPTKRSGVIITDENGNKIVLAEAGEDLLKGDVLYISGFNAGNNPIVNKAIANDRNKSLVFGVASEDMKKGSILKVMISGVLTGVPTNKKEVTLWVAKNPLYLSDVVFGGMTKNPPMSPSFVIPVGSVLVVDKINGSIQIGDLAKNTNINTVDKNNVNAFNLSTLNSGAGDMRDYWYSIFGNDPFAGGGDYNGNGFNNGTGFDSGAYPPFNPITLPTNGGGGNGTGTTINNGGNNGNGGGTGTTINNGGNNGNGGGTGTTGTGTGTGNGTGAGNGTGGTGTTGTGTGTGTGTNTGAIAPAAVNQCLAIVQNPITFTEAEKTQLADLLRKFYLLAPKLKTADDVNLTYSEMLEYNTFSNQLDGLINECYAQSVTKNGIKNPNYSGPTTRYGNPWYDYENRGSYIDYNNLPSSCFGTIKEGASAGGNCSQFSDKNSCVNGTGCNWINYSDDEKILNVW